MASPLPSAGSVHYDPMIVSKTASVSIPNSHLRHGVSAMRGPSPPSSVPSNTTPSTPYLNTQDKYGVYSHQLPTPATSISPSLPPQMHGYGVLNGTAYPATVDSDIEITGNAGKTNGRLGVGAPASFTHSQPLQASPSLIAQAASQPITPTLLAKHYLPDILLQHGPLAIRHLTAYLLSALPGFSAIPPAKQRRLVVGALEGRGGSSGTGESAPGLAHGGINGDVIFEKVGWGRWDARKEGDPPRETVNRPPNSPLNVPGIAIQLHSEINPRSADAIGTIVAEMHASTSWTGESGVFLHSEDERSGRSMSPLTSTGSGEEAQAEEADRMSLDEHDDISMGSSSDLEEDADVTDEEDWAKMGAAMLRRQDAASQAKVENRTGVVGSPNVQIVYGSSGGTHYNVIGGEYRHGSIGAYRASSTGRGGLEFYDNGEIRNKEEREAIEALVKLSSI